MLLPKDILKHARKFTPQESERAIINTITGTSKSEPDSSIIPRQDLELALLKQVHDLGLITSTTTSTNPFGYTTTNVEYIKYS